MSWECGCGVVNSDSRPKCSSCGTPKGTVWTPHGFKGPDEAARFQDSVPAKQGYLGGWFVVVYAAIHSIIFAIIAVGGTQDQDALLGALFLAALSGLIASAAGLRKPWGWYVLVVSIAIASIFFAVGGVVGVAAMVFAGIEESLAVIIGFIPAIPVNLAWFVYFYKRRAMFGAKGRWQWFERTFPSFVGPEDEVSVAMAEPAGKERASQMGPSQESVQLVAKTASPTKAPEYPTGGDHAFLAKRCPRCAETIGLEELECRYCQHPFQPQEVATDIRQALAERAKEVAARIDYSSTTKTCPKCAETIKMEVPVCRYCRFEFTDAMVQAAKVSALRAAWNHIYEVPGGAQIQVRRSDSTAENRMRNRRIGLSSILVGLLFALAPIPFLEFKADHPAPDLEGYIRAGYIEVREAVATPRFATVVKGQENPNAKPVQFEERRPIIEFDTSYSDDYISKVLSATFPLGAKPLLDPRLERVRFAGWEVERGPVTIPYRVLIVAALGLVLLGLGAILWPAGPGGSP